MPLLLVIVEVLGGWWGIAREVGRVGGLEKSRQKTPENSTPLTALGSRTIRGFSFSSQRFTGAKVVKELLLPSILGNCQPIRLITSVQADDQDRPFSSRSLTLPLPPMVQF